MGGGGGGGWGYITNLLSKGDIEIWSSIGGVQLFNGIAPDITAPTA